MASPTLQRQCFFVLACLTMIQVCAGGAPKVTLDLYYESLCPYCANFIVNELPTIFKNGIIDIVDLRLFPWGNAKLTSNNSFTCQHGATECLFNTIEACAIDAWPKLDDHFPFVTCVETLVYEGKYPQWETCFKELGLDPKPVTSCYKDAYGIKLNLKYAAITAALKPPHEYVPWVVVAGQPLYDDYENFISYVCKAYKGPLPIACTKASFASSSKEKNNHFRSVHYTELTTKAPYLIKIWSVMASWANQMT